MAKEPNERPHRPGRHIPIGPAGAQDNRDVRRRKQAFAARVRKLMLTKDWNQSDLARHAGLNRDQISTWLNARSFPTEPSAHKLAKALGVAVDDLFPDHMDDDALGATQEFEMRQDPRDSTKFILRINRTVSLSVAAKIIDLIKEDGEAE